MLSLKALPPPLQGQPGKARLWGLRTGPLSLRTGPFSMTAAVLGVQVVQHPVKFFVPAFTDHLALDAFEFRVQLILAHRR